MREQILEDLKNAMKNQDKEKLSVIRMLKGAMQLEEINLKRNLNDGEVISIIAKQIKTRKESIESFIAGNRSDLVDKTEQEIKVLSEYLPKQLTEDEIKKELENIIAEVKPNGIQDMGKIMAKAKEVLNGKADLGYVSKLIKEKLN
ncbi:MAG: GatB/YqeY domain-containing protein [Bacilli bacterium]|nr:GatB/YqeY domain-containing protein [Bacilli bacterium]